MTIIKRGGELLQRELEGLGLSGNEAQVLRAVLRLGSGNSQELAKASGVARTNVYRVLEDLAFRRLVERVPGPGPAAWASPALDEVVDRLHLDEEERLRAERVEQAERVAALYREEQLRAQDLERLHEERIASLGERVAAVRKLLNEEAAPGTAFQAPKAQVIPTAAQVTRTYERLLATVQSELLVVVRPPYAVNPGVPKPPILDAVARGVRARALYASEGLDSPESEGFRREMEAYHRAGVTARVVDGLPVKMALFDRAVAFVALMGSGSGAGEGGYPSFLLVEDAGFAHYLADAFDRRWAEGRPYKKKVAARRR